MPVSIQQIEPPLKYPLVFRSFPLPGRDFESCAEDLGAYEFSHCCGWNYGVLDLEMAGWL